LNHQISGEVLTVKFAGEIDISNLETIDGYVSGFFDGKKEIVFDFDEVYYIDSAGLSYLLKCDRTIRRTGRFLAIRNLFGQVKRIFEVSGVNEHLTTADTQNIPNL